MLCPRSPAALSLAEEQGGAGGRKERAADITGHRWRVLHGGKFPVQLAGERWVQGQGEVAAEWGLLAQDAADIE